MGEEDHLVDEHHPSRKTRERAYILARNAKQLEMPVGAARYAPNLDFMSYWFTNNIDYILIFCMPTGYLAELWQDTEGMITTTYLSIVNIRTLLSNLKKLNYRDVDEVLGDVDGYIESEDNEETDN
ncbi:hypothetical protein E4G67_00430 [Candidatus Bathyarchaeota archaeon]|nr:MAG: hypothetical protein E4G67_00430 [Candidatus Bathyarchaeota archaeon]